MEHAAVWSSMEYGVIWNSMDQYRAAWNNTKHGRWRGRRKKGEGRERECKKMINNNRNLAK